MIPCVLPSYKKVSEDSIWEILASPAHLQGAQIGPHYYVYQTSETADTIQLKYMLRLQDVLGYFEILVKVQSSVEGRSSEFFAHKNIRAFFSKARELLEQEPTHTTITKQVVSKILQTVSSFTSVNADEPNESAVSIKDLLYQVKDLQERIPVKVE